MGKFRDLTGQRFGKLVAINIVDDYVSPNGYHKKRWKCMCDCGKETIVWASSLISNHTISCGCVHTEKLSHGNPKHGMCHSRIYTTWQGMFARCYNPNSTYYKNYGGRGINICEDWYSFELFYLWAIENGYEDNLTIDRIDVNGNYCPINCKWSDKKEQANNTTRNVFIEIDGERMTVSQWEEKMGFKRGLIKSRLARGWNEKDAILIEPKTGNRYSNIIKNNA